MRRGHPESEASIKLLDMVTAPLTVNSGAGNIMLEALAGLAKSSLIQIICCSSGA